MDLFVSCCSVYDFMFEIFFLEENIPGGDNVELQYHSSSSFWRKLLPLNIQITVMIHLSLWRFLAHCHAVISQVKKLK
jgi:hypothetical protein